jgi:hypothetical protein
MAFVLHKCKDDKKPKNDHYDQYKVSILLNEMPIELYGIGEEFACSIGQNSNEKSVCSFKSFKNLLKPYLNQNFTDVCNLKNEFKRRSFVSTSDTLDDNILINNEL